MAQTKTCWQIFAIVMHIVAVIFLLTTAGLFYHAYILYNNELNGLGHRNSKICILDLNEDFTYARNSTCNFSFVSEVLTALLLVILAILTCVKIKCACVG